MPTGIYERTEEHKRKFSNIQKLLWSNPKYKKRMSETHKGRVGCWAGKKRNAEFKENARKSMKRRWQNPEYRKLMAKVRKKQTLHYQNLRPIPKRCECGCGEYANSRKRFIQGHHIRINNYLLKPETIEKVKKTRKEKGIKPWNTGLTKETDNRILIKSEFMKINNPMKDANIVAKFRGEGNPRWLGGKSFEPYGIEFNNKLKESIRKRDDYKCKVCKISENGKAHDIHHLDYNKENNKPENLITLCHSCHSKTNSKRKYWQYYFKGEMSCQLQLIT